MAKFKPRRQIVYDYLTGRKVSARKAKKLSKKFYFKNEINEYLRKF